MIMFSSMTESDIYSLGYDANATAAVPFSSLKNNSILSIFEIGVEEDPQKAHWGPAVRDFYIIHYVTQGSGFFNGQPVSKGQGFVIGKNQLHEYHSSENDPWRYFWILFNGNDDELKRTFDNVNIKLENGVFDYSFLPELLHFIEENLYRPVKSLSSYKALSMFYSLLAFHESTTKKDGLISVTDSHVTEAIIFMDTFYFKSIKITDIADSIFVDDRYLYNLFKKRFGISPKEYLNNIRISKACAMLTSTNLPVSTIANSVGYTDALAFSRFFKKRVGESPIKYRVNNANSASGAEQYLR